MKNKAQENAFLSQYFHNCKHAEKNYYAFNLNMQNKETKKCIYGRRKCLKHNAKNNIRQKLHQNMVNIVKKTHL